MENKIEELIHEIKELKTEIKELKGIEYERVIPINDEELEDKDVIEIISTTKFLNGKPISMTTDYKYKEDNI